MRKLWFRTFCATICLAVVLGSTGLLSGLDEAAAAGATRVAVVTSLKGDVQVKKSGGSKFFSAFKNMSLNEGDLITTGKNSSVTLDLASSKADQDSITIGENSQVQFTKLKEDTGAKAKMSVWAGSLWVKVKSISNAEDTFEVETPTAIMGVRGTHFILAVDPITGKTTLVVASGVMAANSTQATFSGGGSSGPKNVVHVYPTQQMDIDADAQTDDARSLIMPTDPATLVLTMPSEIIEAMVSNMGEIIRENAELAQQLEQSVGQGVAAPDPNANLLLLGSEDLSAYSQNMNALVAVVLAEAVNQGVISEDTARNIVDQINEIIEDPGLRISLDNVPEYNKDFGVDPELKEKREKARQQQEERERQKEQRRQELLEKNRDKAEQIAENKSQLDQANQTAKSEKEQDAYNKYRETLPEEEKSALDQRKKERDQERQQQRQQEQPGGTTGPGSGGSPGGSPGGDNGGGDGDNGDGDGDTPPSEAISATVVQDDQYPELLVLEIKMSNFTNVFGFQADVSFNEDDLDFLSGLFGNNSGWNKYRNLVDSPFKVELASGWTSDNADYNDSLNAVDHYEVIDLPTNAKQVRYAVMKFATGTVDVNGQVVARLPFSLKSTENSETTFNITLKVVTVDDQNEILEITKTYSVTHNIGGVQVVQSS